MHKIYVPKGSEKSQSWQGVLNDLHRGRTVGSPTEVEWHPHNAEEPCGDDCMLVRQGIGDDIIVEELSGRAE